MPQRTPELPEGTDHIVNGAMETGVGTGASTGSSGGLGGSTGGAASGMTGTGGSSGSFIGGGAGNGTGGTSLGGGSGSTGGSSGSSRGSGKSGAAEKLAGQVRDQVSNLRGQATDKVMQFADTGKQRATTTLDDFSAVLNEAARSVDERLGAEYGQYAHRAADAVSSFTDSLRGKSVDELLDDSRSVIRKSPSMAIGAAAVLGFALVRIIKAGLPEDGSQDRTDVTFTPDTSGQFGSGRPGTAIGSGTTTTSTTGV